MLNTRSGGEKGTSRLIIKNRINNIRIKKILKKKIILIKENIQKNNIN